MNGAISVVYENGVFKPLEPVELEEGTPGHVMVEESPSPATRKARTLGMYPGAFEFSDDFDEPLPDEFWYGRAEDEIS